MNEEQAILDFFSRPENLSLSLKLAEQMDMLREQMNNRFWRETQLRLGKMQKELGLAWLLEPTEDRNAPDRLVGLHCDIGTKQPLYLRPMLEQQYLGKEWRIYFGLMWSTLPAPAQLEIPAVKILKASLQKAGFKSNESFLAWRWTAFHPRSKDFLLRYAHQPEKLLDEAAGVFATLLADHCEAIDSANAALDSPQHSLAASLDSLRNELID